MATSSDYNLHRISTKELEQHLKATIEIGGNLFVCGQRGSGKSFISNDAIKNSGYKKVFWNLSTAERVDIGGYPRLLDAKTSDYIGFLLPNYYKDLIEGNRDCVLLLDEVDKANLDLLAPILEILQFHTINGRELKGLRAVIMTGNLLSEGGQRPPLPMLDRTEKYLLEGNVLDWFDWAKWNGIHPSITSYITDHPQDLFSSENDAETSFATASPRSWHLFSDMLTFGESKNWSNKLLSSKANGFVGKQIGIRYSSYFDHYQVLLPLVEKIMKGERLENFDNLEPSKQLITCMIVCTRLSRQLDEMRKSRKKELPPEVDRVGEFLQTVDPEMSLISIRSQIGRDKMIINNLDMHPSFGKILDKLAKRIEKGQ